MRPYTIEIYIGDELILTLGEDIIGGKKDLLRYQEELKEAAKALSAFATSNGEETCKDSGPF